MSSKSSKSKPAKPANSKTSAPVTPAAATIGQRLAARRLARGLNLKDVELATRIRGKYLVAIEADSYQDLPHDVYSRGFVQSYAAYLGLEGPAIAKAYLEQRGHQELQLRRVNTVSTSKAILTPRRLTLVGGTLAALVVGVYLVLQLSALTASPSLHVANPSKDQVLYGSLITVSGSVQGGADVYVNNSPILVDGNGNFTDAIALQDGVNSIQISAKNSLGKTTTVTRNILAHVPKTDPASALPTAPFNGVAVSIQVQTSATTLNVRIDGKQSFKGTMLPGTTQIFKGQNAIVISTTNGGATVVTVTNSQTAGKSLGALGGNGQPKTDYEFDKDTQFQ